MRVERDGNGERDGEDYGIVDLVDEVEVAAEVGGFVDVVDSAAGYYVGDGRLGGECKGVFE